MDSSEYHWPLHCVHVCNCQSMSVLGKLESVQNAHFLLVVIMEPVEQCMSSSVPVGTQSSRGEPHEFFTLLIRSGFLITTSEGI